MTHPAAPPPDDAHVRAVAEGIDHALHPFGDPVTGTEPSLLPFEMVSDTQAAELNPHLVRHSEGEAR